MLTALIPLSSYAIFQEIYEGYQKSNRLNAIKISDSIYDANNVISKQKYDWVLNLGTTRSDSGLASIFSASSLHTISTVHTIELAKSSFKYGTFFLKHLNRAYDLSNWPSADVYESKNIFGYNLEILNDSTRIDWDIIQTTYKKDRATNKVAIHRDYLDFFVAYIKAKNLIHLDLLYNDFRIRSKKRVSLVRKRVKDGLSRNTDLIQAKLSLVERDEMIIKNENTLRESLSIIEDLVGFDIGEDKYGLIPWTFKKSEKYDSVYKLNQDIQTEMQKYIGELAKFQVKQIDESYGHSLGLSLSYSKNFIGNNKSEATQKAFGDSDKAEQVISLLYSIPLGGARKSALRKKTKLTAQKYELKLKNLKSTLRVQRSEIKLSIERIEKAIKLGDRKVNLSSKLVRQTTRLYQRGQKSFEDVLRSEENLIKSKISLKSLYASHEIQIANLSFINGNIVKYLNKYVD